MAPGKACSAMTEDERPTRATQRVLQHLVSWIVQFVRTKYANWGRFIGLHSASLIGRWKLNQPAFLVNRSFAYVSSERVTALNQPDLIPKIVRPAPVAENVMNEPTRITTSPRLAVIAITRNETAETKRIHPTSAR